VIFTKGTFPSSWRKSTIIPIHKNGSFDNPDNHRGISLLNILSKVFTSILNRRLVQWAEEHNHIVEQQAGFRKNYSTVDNIFILHSVIERYLKRKKKLYVSFIDFKKAFDYVNRNTLWKILRSYGITGRMLKILQSIYTSVRSHVRCQEGTSEDFECPRGLKQGCNLSSTLFVHCE